MADINPEIQVQSGSDQQLTCIFDSNPPVEQIIWYKGKDDKGEVIKEDEMEPRENDKYTSTLLLENIRSNMTVTCVATQKQQYTKETREFLGEAFTYILIEYILNQGICSFNIIF